jgi:hypothetical protein
MLLMEVQVVLPPLLMKRLDVDKERKTGFKRNTTVDMYSAA